MTPAVCIIVWEPCILDCKLKDTETGSKVNEWIGVHVPSQMCVSRCLQCVGRSLAVLALICMLSNVLLLLPQLKIHFLLEGHVTREATWATGLWASGLMVLFGARSILFSSRTKGCCAFRTQMLRQVLSSSLCLLAASICCLVSVTGLVQGPLCLYNATTGPTWDVPLKPDPDNLTLYLYNRTLWSVCLQPHSVVEWNIVLFSVMGVASLLQAILCASNVLNSLLGMIVGPGLCKNQVTPTPPPQGP
ncbi:transmembrane 4 L6 family member 5 isoform X2 [Cynoglossus semilaevis]|uniref:transmembrane 4 L6 family member 5 isoform X2 n=1 Tax=Cynoglossus semilaevis TaxID=244447 RepID=UPI000495BD60|nr:transmembrane 4 L6 family member 5 isoform X2 [Cynoglossus semilaevis]